MRSKLTAWALVAIGVLAMAGCAASGSSEADLDRYAAAARVFNGSEQGNTLSRVVTLNNVGEATAHMTTAENGEDVILIVYIPKVDMQSRYEFDPYSESPPPTLNRLDLSGTGPPDIDEWNTIVDEDGYLRVRGRESESIPEYFNR